MLACLEFSDFRKHRVKQIYSSSLFILWSVKHHRVCDKFSSLYVRKIPTHIQEEEQVLDLET